MAGTDYGRVPCNVHVMHSDIMSGQSHSDTKHRHEITDNAHTYDAPRSQPLTAQTQNKHNTYTHIHRLHMCTRGEGK